MEMHSVEPVHTHVDVESFHSRVLAQVDSDTTQLEFIINVLKEIN